MGKSLESCQGSRRSGTFRPALPFGGQGNGKAKAAHNMETQVLPPDGRPEGLEVLTLVVRCGYLHYGYLTMARRHTREDDDREARMRIQQWHYDSLRAARKMMAKNPPPPPPAKTPSFFVRMVRLVGNLFG